MHIKEIRTIFTAISASGKIFINGRYYCESLADRVQLYGIKVPGETAVPPCLCNVIIDRSRRFGRDMLLIYNRKDYSIEVNNIRFTGIRAHGGNTHKDVGGCTAVAQHRKNDDKIYGSMERPLLALVRDAIAKGEIVYWEYINS